MRFKHVVWITFFAVIVMLVGYALWWMRPYMPAIALELTICGMLLVAAGTVTLLCLLAIGVHLAWHFSRHWLENKRITARVIPVSEQGAYALQGEGYSYTALMPASVHATQYARLTHGTRQDQQGQQQVPALPAPETPTGRQLLLDGTVEQALAEGYIILGPGDDGKLKRLKIKKCFTMLVSGLPAVGKTTTVFWITGQLTLIGAKLWVVDPHLYFQDEDGNKSLAAELSELSDSFVFPPCDSDAKQIRHRVKWMYQQLRIRQRPGYIVRAEETIIGVMDEYNSVADSIDPKETLVTYEGKSLNFAQTVSLIEREGRKYGLHFMLIGHKWGKQNIGGDEAIRTNATTYLCHKMNDTTQADLLLGKGQGKNALALTVGSYWITGPTWNDAPAKITTPMLSAADLPLLREIKQQGSVSVVNQANVIESTISEVVPMPFPTYSQVLPDDDKLNNGNDGGKHAEPVEGLDMVKLRCMRDLVLKRASQSEIITSVFPGMRNVDATAEYRRYLAALTEGAAS